MSYFMTTAGPWIDLSDLWPLELVPAENAQYYIKDMQAFLFQEDGEPVYLVHDGETGTSHNIINAASTCFAFNYTLVGSSLLELFERFCHSGHVFRIWYASNEQNVHTQVLQCNSLEEVIYATEMYLETSQDIQLRYAGRQL
jgi:hypothetical protein